MSRFYMQKPGYVGNLLIWWREGSSGYTTKIAEAQLYTKEEADSIVRTSSNSHKAWPEEEVRSLAAMTVDSEDIKAKRSAKVQS